MNELSKDWTLGQLQEYCRTHIGADSCGGRCPFQPICDAIISSKIRVIPGQFPINWELGTANKARRLMRMHKTKCLKDWTVGELQSYCRANVGKATCKNGCPFKATCDHIGEWVIYGDSVIPAGWSLTESPRWTAEDIADAEAIRRVHPKTVTVERSAFMDGLVALKCDEGRDIWWGDRALIPSLEVGECVLLDDILSAKGSLEGGGS